MKLKKITNNLNELNINKIARRVFSDEYIQRLIIELNQEQLQAGKYFDGEVIRTYGATTGNVYANSTIDLKKLKGQAYNRVTLFDEGDFYNSFDIEVNKAFAEIIADFDKENGQNISDNVDIRKVLGLSDENKKILLDELKKETLLIVRSELV